MKKKKQKYPPEYQNYVLNCNDDNIEPMSYDLWVKNHNTKQENLSRWNGSRTAPSLWEKMKKDPVYMHTLTSRIPTDEFGDTLCEEPSMGYRKKLLPRQY